MPPRPEPPLERRERDTEPVPGHLFVILGDLNKVACDAVMIPTDDSFTIEKAWKQTIPDGLSGWSWNGNRVIRASLDDRDAVPRVWLGNVGGTETTPPEHFTGAVAEFIAQATDDLATGRGKGVRPVPLLAINLVGTGRGGAAAQKGGLIRRLLETVKAELEDRAVDVVLVTWSKQAYAAVQHERRSVFPPRIADERLQQEAEALAARARSGHLVLFIGAGVSAGAGLPTWTDLLARAAEAAGLEENRMAALLERDARDAASILDRRLKGELRREVARIIGEEKRYSLAHGLLASLPTCEAVTTNYDTLFEAAAQAGGRRLAILPDAPVDADGRWLLKLHGSVERPQSIVITRSDYLNMPRQYGALMGLVQAMLLMRHMLFVGYSLSDEDFHELLHEVRAAGGEAIDRSFGTVLPLFTDPLTDDLWRSELDIVPMSGVEKTSGGRDVTGPARTLEIFLDLLAHYASDGREFLLDDSYAQMLTDDERLVAEALKTLARSPAMDTDAAEPITAFLRSLGHGGGP